MKLPSGCYVLAVVATFGTPLFSDEVSAQAQLDGATNATSGKAFCTRLIEIVLSRVAAKTPIPRAESVVPTFYLYTRNNTKRQEILRMALNGNVPSNYFDPERDTKFIIHGFLGRGTNEWIENLREALLVWANVNVIVVDWSRAAANPYTQAAANTAIVGQQIAELINSLIENYGGSPEDFHLIGHSLGSHVAGYAGEALTGLGRITGLDPAGPLFIPTEEINRLDPSDANFVDVIHTDKDCLGIRMPLGHVDFYPNGGTEQPGCGVMETLRDNYIGGTLASLDSSFCSHFRAVKLFTESILFSPPFDATENEVALDQCQLIGILCDSYENFILGRCNNDADENIRTAVMGINADMIVEQYSTDPPPRTYYLMTNAGKPYCLL